MYQVVRVWEHESGATFRNLRAFNDKNEAHNHKTKLQGLFPGYLFWVTGPVVDHYCTDECLPSKGAGAVQVAAAKEV